MWSMAVLAVSWSPACADTILYSDSGTFLASTPSSAFSGPSKTWAFAFQADVNPVVSDVGNGGFDFQFSSFSYLLNSLPVAIAPTFIRFFSGINGGGFVICFNGTNNANCSDALGTFGPQMYTGPTSSPTLLAGTFTSEVFNVYVNSAINGLPNTTLQASTVPEPSSFLMVVAALLAIGAGRYRRR